jgi:hypothetical protein
MDIGAYAAIEQLTPIAQANGIDVPRLRGYRLMSEEKAIDNTSDFYNIELISEECVRSLCESVPTWSLRPIYYALSRKTERLAKRYTMFGAEYYEIRWDRIHGKKRKILKTKIKSELKRRKKQADTFNKYVGRPDVLYIHARIGGGNWKTYCNEVIHQPWFIEKVDDAEDSTYCDIYARIKEVK